MRVKYLMLACALFALPLVSSASPAHHKAHQGSQLSQDIAHVLGFLIVLNKNEIAAAHLAAAKTSNADVKKFAALMVKDHGNNLRKTEALGQRLHIKPIKGPNARKLQAQGLHELKHLKTLKEPSFDKAYMDAMVKGHADAAHLISDLTHQASNPLVKKHLETTEMHVNKHLDKATHIQQELH